MDSGVDSFLHPKCHHQIIYSKPNLKMEYPSPYSRKVWGYNRAETDLINGPNAINNNKLSTGIALAYLWKNIRENHF